MPNRLDGRGVAAGLLAFALAFASSASAAWAGEDSGEELPGDGGADGKCPSHVPADRETDARSLTLLGVACFKQEKYARAYTFYHRAYQEDRSDTLRAAMGRSLHELGVYQVAKSYYETFLDNAEPDRQSTEKIQKRLEQLGRDLDQDAAHTKLRSFPSGASVHLQLSNGQWVELGQTPTEVRLREAEYRFAFDHADHRRRRVRRELAASSNPETIAVDLYPTRAGFDTSSRQWKKAGLITGLSSIPVLGLGGLFFGLSANKFAEAEDLTGDGYYDPDRENALVYRGHRQREIGIGFTALGAAAAITGGVLFLRGKGLEPSGESSRSTSEQETSERQAFRPVVTPRSIGFRARF